MIKMAPCIPHLVHATAKPLVKMFYLFVLLTSIVCNASGAEGTGAEGTKGEMRSDATLQTNPLRLSIEGISANEGEDEPRVLTILPWRAPTLPRRPRAELESSAPELVQALDPVTLERHREFRRGLGVTHPGDRQ